MDHLALNVYLHDAAEQHAFVTGALAPALRALRDAGVLRRAWFSRFDARGPHLAVLVSTPAGQVERARERLARSVEEWLGAQPPLAVLPPETVEQRHAECRGKQLNAIDTQPGFSAPGTFAFAAHGASAYPFWIFPEGDDALWALLTELALANAAGAPEGMSASGLAMRWMAAVDVALAEAGADAAEYWCRHAGTLLPNLAERLAADEAAVIDALPRTVGERNLAALERIWAAVEAHGGDDADRARRLVNTLLATRAPADAWTLLREANHCGLLQMGQPVRAHLPAILYAWHRALRPAAA